MVLFLFHPISLSSRKVLRVQYGVWTCLVYRKEKKVKQQISLMTMNMSRHTDRHSFASLGTRTCMKQAIKQCFIILTQTRTRDMNQLGKKKFFFAFFGLVRSSAYCLFLQVQKCFLILVYVYRVTMFHTLLHYIMTEISCLF